MWPWGLSCVRCSRLHLRQLAWKWVNQLHCGWRGTGFSQEGRTHKIKCLVLLNWLHWFPQWYTVAVECCFSRGTFSKSSSLIDRKVSRKVSTADFLQLLHLLFWLFFPNKHSVWLKFTEYLDCFLCEIIFNIFEKVTIGQTRNCCCFAFWGEMQFRYLPHQILKWSLGSQQREFWQFPNGLGHHDLFSSLTFSPAAEFSPISCWFTASFPELSKAVL